MRDNHIFKVKFVMNFPAFGLKGLQLESHFTRCILCLIPIMFLMSKLIKPFLNPGRGCAKEVNKSKNYT